MESKKGLVQLKQLVETLTSSEKRYVSLFLSRHAGERSGSKKLFDELIRISGSPGKDSGIKSAEVKAASTKKTATLTDDILNALRFFHDEQRIDTTLRKLMIDADFLFSKGLYALSLDKMKDAKKMATRFERRSQLLEILRMEAAVLKSAENRDMEGRIITNHAEQEETVERLAAENAERRKLDIAEMQMRFNLFNSGEYMTDRTNEIIQYDNRHGFLYNFCRLSAIALDCTRHRQMEKAYSAYTLLMLHWKKQPSLLVSERLHLKRTLANFIVVCQYLEKHKEAAERIAELKAIPATTADEKAEQFQVVKFAELMLLMNEKKWDRLEEIVRDIEKGLIFFKAKVNKARELAFRCNIGIAWIMVENWEQALGSFNTIINAEKTNYRIDIQHLARILRLIVYYELGKFDFMEYELINVERYLRAAKAWFSYEALVIKTLKKLLVAQTDERLQYFLNLKENIEGLKKNVSNSMQPGINELELWALHHIRSKPIKEVLAAQNY